MSSRTICDNCKKVAFDGLEVGWIVLSGWSTSISDPYFSIGIVEQKRELGLTPYAGLDFCSVPCLSDWFSKLHAKSRGEFRE